MGAPRRDDRTGRYRTLLWIGLIVFVAGRLVDLAWHATHPEFETAADQVRAHLVVWTDALLLLVTNTVMVGGAVWVWLAGRRRAQVPA